MAKLTSVNGKPEENIEEEVREETFSAEETKNQLRVKEDDFIAGMLSAAAYKSEEVSQIDIVRGGKLFFSFRIHALGEEEANKSRKSIRSMFVTNRSESNSQRKLTMRSSVLPSFTMRLLRKTEISCGTTSRYGMD